MLCGAVMCYAVTWCDWSLLMWPVGSVFSMYLVTCADMMVFGFIVYRLLLVWSSCVFAVPNLTHSQQPPVTCAASSYSQPVCTSSCQPAQVPIKPAGQPSSHLANLPASPSTQSASQLPCQPASPSTQPAGQPMFWSACQFPGDCMGIAVLCTCCIDGR